MTFERRRAYNPKREWKSSEESRLLNFLKSNSFDSKKLQELFPDRTLASIRSKTRKLRIANDLFGESYREDKMRFTDECASSFDVKTVFEAYAGAGHQTRIWTQHCSTVFASDHGKGKEVQFEATMLKDGFKKMKSNGGWQHYSKGEVNVYFFHGDALDAAIELRSEKIHVDTVDLDTCGSTLPTLPTILNLLSPKFLLITHGEFHSMRFKRDDVLRRVLMHRDIKESCLDLSVDELAEQLDKSVKIAALRTHNETTKSFWPELKHETWLGSKFHGMLRRAYLLERPAATSDCLNELIGS